MEGTRVLNIDTASSWDLAIAQATLKSCPLLAYFDAEWCGPCKMISTSFQKLAAQYPFCMFVHLDIDQLQGVAREMNVKAVPTFLFLVKGQQIDKVVGANIYHLKKRLDMLAFTLSNSHNPLPLDLPKAA